MVKTPWEAFMLWFDEMPISLRKSLAHVYRVCTTEDTSMMTGSSEDSLEGFRNWAIGRDFPLRVAARMFTVRSVFDMVIIHHREILNQTGMGTDQETGKLVQLSDKQWENVLESWHALRKAELSDSYIHSWTSWMVKLQTVDA